MKFPIRIPDGWKLTISQGFKSQELSDYYKRLGLNWSWHEGLDVVCGDPRQTYGSAVVWPFPWPGKTYEAAVNAPIGATVAHAQVDGTDPATGIFYSVIYLHLSGLTDKKDFNQGDVVGYIGNNGAVLPVPTADNPFSGSHLHLGLFIKNPGELNTHVVDPSLYFDINDPYRGPDDPNRDSAPIVWAEAKKHHVFSRDLAYGDKNEEVATLQKVLQIQGIFPSSTVVTGFYGDITRNAVLAFRVKYGISSSTDPLGKSVGPLTRAALNNL